MTEIINGSKGRKFKTFCYTGFQDEKLSLKAKGLLAYLLSKPEGWKGQLFDIMKSCPEKTTAIRTALKDLVEHGYAKLVSHKDNTGKFKGKSYVFFDEPKKHQ